MWFTLTALAAAIFLALIGLLLVGVGWVINRLASVLLPLAVATIIAYLLDPVADYVEARFKYSRLKAILVVFTGMGMLIVALGWAVVPQVYKQASGFIREFGGIKTATVQTAGEVNLGSAAITADSPAPGEEKVQAASTNTVSPNILERFTAWAGNTKVGKTINGMLPNNDSNELKNILYNNLNFILGMLVTKTTTAIKSVASLTGFVIGFAMVPVFVFFFLLEENKIVENWTFYLPVKNKKWKEELVFILTCINDSLIVFFRGQVLVGLCLGVLIALGFSIIGLKYAILLGVMAAILSIIPYLGVVLSLIPALAIAFVQSGSGWGLPLQVLIVFVLVQMSEGLIISPKIIGDRVGMHPLTIIIAVLIGTTLLGGIVGGVLAIPLTAALRAIMYRYVWKRAPSRSVVKNA